jgi:myo-inositol-1(or 4)-monophosphatase
MAAGLLLVREAGGFVTDIEGGDAMFTQRNIVAGNDTILGELRALLQAAGEA